MKELAVTVCEYHINLMTEGLAQVGIRVPAESSSWSAVRAQIGAYLEQEDAAEGRSVVVLAHEPLAAMTVVQLFGFLGCSSDPLALVLVPAAGVCPLCYLRSAFLVHCAQERCAGRVVHFWDEEWIQRAAAAVVELRAAAHSGLFLPPITLH